MGGDAAILLSSVTASGNGGTSNATPRAVNEGGPQTMAELLPEVERDAQAVRPLRPGETVEGTVAGITGDAVRVDLAGRSAGILRLREASASPDDPLEVADTVLALVVQPEGPQGHAVLSLRHARRARRWREMAERQKKGDVLAAPVVEANRGGVIVDVGVSDSSRSPSSRRSVRSIAPSKARACRGRCARSSART
jgi:small subunit ribosomal protein S1